MYHLIRTNSTTLVSQKKFAQQAFSLKRINQRFFYLCLFMMFSLMSVQKVNAQTTYNWTFATAYATSGSNANLTVDSFKQLNNNGTTVPRISGSVSSGYSGASGTFNLQAATRTGPLNTGASGSAYYELTLTPAAGYVVQVTGLTFGRRGTSTGAQRYVVKTSKDAYVDSLAADTMANNSGWALESPTVTAVTSAVGTALTLRMYLYNGTGSASANTANFRIDDVNLTVNVIQAPSVPTAGNQTVCSGGTIPNITATAGAGETIDWYAAASGGSVLTSGTATTSYATGQTVAGTYTYYAQARNTTNGLVSASRRAVTLTITQSVTPTLDIDASDLQPVPGDPVDFYINDQTNQGTAPTYQWYKNGSSISLATAATYSTSTLADNDSFYLAMTSNAACASPLTVKSNVLVMIISSGGCSGTPPATTTIASSTNVCSGGSSNFSLTGLGGAGGYTFQWQDSVAGGSWNNISGAAAATYLGTPASTRYYRCVVTCSVSSVSTPSSSLLVTVTANATPNVTIATATNPSCAGASVTYLATPINGGGSPTYAWYKVGNATPVQTGSSANYISSSLADGDQIYVILTSNYACLTRTNDTSAATTHNVTANVAASVSIANPVNPSCSGASITFTATPTNGGTPTYQWYNGATPISLETAATYTSSSVTNASSITVRMTSSVTCVTGSPATSNAIVQTVTANVTPTVTITSSNPIICNSGGTTFTGSSRNGGTPTYNWYLNGNIVKTSSTDSSYTLSSVTNNDSVYATITSSITCVTTATVASNGIKESVVTPSTPTVSISANPAAVSGIVSVNAGSNITFTATPTFGGTTPTYQWKLGTNNISGATSSTYSSTSLANASIISCVMVSNYACKTNDTAISSNLSVSIVSNTPFTPGNVLVYKVGDGVGNLVNTGNPVYLDEYTQSGTFVQSKRLTSTTTSDTSIYSGGTGTTEGMMTLSVDGRYIAAPGYYTYTRTDSAITSSRVPRVAATIDINQNVDLGFKLNYNDWSGSGTARSVITTDGTKFYVTGSAGGVRYAATPTTTRTSTQLSTSVTNIRNVGIFNGQLYVSSQSGAFRLSTVGTGTPTTSSQTIANLPGFATSTGSPYGFFFASSSIVYVTDDGTRLVTKYVLSGGTWSANGTVATDSACRGMTGFVNGSTVTLFLTSGGSSATGGGEHIYKITDALGTSTLSGSATKIVNNGNTSDRMVYRGICFAPTAIASQPSSTTVCVGSTTTFSVAMASGTNAVYTYQWQSSTNGTTWNNVTNGSIYSGVTTTTVTVLDPTGLNSIQYRCQVTYMGNSILNSNSATLTVPTTVTPGVSISTANTTVCSGSNVTFTATGTNTGSSPSYQWYKNGSNAGNGTSITFLAGTLANGDSISCILTANNTCQTSATATSNKIGLTVNASPAIGVSTGGGLMCVLGSTKPVYNSNTLGGGVWSSSNPSVATVTTVTGSSGLVTAISNGIDTLTYTKTATNGCTSSAFTVMTISTVSAISPISGTNSICKGATTTLNTSTTGGVWSSLNNYATIAGNVVTGTNAGTAVIRYTVTNGSCSAYASYNVTVNAIPNVPQIGYASGTMNPQTGGSGGFCVGRTFTVVGTPSGGVWSSTNTLVATVDPNSGFVSMVGTGSTSLRYAYTNANSCTNTKAISGNGVVCASRGVNINDVIASKAEVKFDMYPNPAKTFISLNVETLIGQGQIIITDLYGKQIKVQPLSMGNNNVNIANISKGFYLVSIITNDGKTTKKLVVE